MGRLGVLAVLGVLLGSVLGPASAAAAPAAPQPDLEEMGSYPVAAFAAEAAALPGELLAALDRDVDLTGAEYLAEASAAVQAVIVVDSLVDAGVDVLGSRMEGTELVVNVQDAAGASLVEQAGATAEIGEPTPFVLDRPARMASDVWNGQGYYWTDDPTDESGYLCSVGFHGFLTATGQPQLATAGHCLEGAENMLYTLDSTISTRPGFGITDIVGFEPLGTPLVSTRRWGTAHSGYDVARIEVTAPGAVPQPGVLTWGFGAGAPTSTPRMTLTGQSAPINGATLCRSGVRTGWACGPVVAVDHAADNFVDENGDEIPGLMVRSVAALVCSLPGDSGGPAIIGTNAVGVLSWTQADPSAGCTPGDASGFFQMVSPGGLESVASAYGAAWELEVVPPAPTVTTAVAAHDPAVISGTVLSGARSSLNSVALYLDGSATPYATDTSVTSGSWSIDVSSVPAGVHTYRVATRYGAWSEGASVSRTFTVDVDPTRVVGADRYDVAAQIATATFPDGADWVFIATGEKYPDALSAAPAAIRAGGPLLLSLPDRLTPSTVSALQELDPENVVIVGGTSSVTADVETAILEALPDLDPDRLTRLSGGDRYDASRNIARFAFDDAPIDTAYISTGLNFPDALSAGGAGGVLDRPVVLVYGASSTVDPETLQLLDDLGVTEVIIAGGPNSVSPGIAASLQSVGYSVTRLSGADRFDASVSINGEAYVEGSAAAVTDAFIATGLNFPDALAGAVMAGTQGGPLYVVPPTCVPFGALQQMAQLGVDDVTLFGGTASLSAGVESLMPC